MLNSTLPTARPIFTTHGHGQNNTTSKLTTNYPHGSARCILEDAWVTCLSIVPKSLLPHRTPPPPPIAWSSVPEFLSANLVPGPSTPVLPFWRVEKIVGMRLSPCFCASRLLAGGCFLARSLTLLTIPSISERNKDLVGYSQLTGGLPCHRP